MSATATLPPRQTRVVPWARLGDETLAGRAAGGNTDAFSALYERYYGPLLGYTRSILLNAEDAHDATQNALESALRALPARDTSRPIRPWLYKIAHNEAINIMRRRRPQTELQPEFEPTVPGPEVDAEQRGRLEQLVDDLQSLPERQRGALVMRELNGLSYEEIGTALGLTLEAARRAVFDARNALHDAADGRATECTSVRHKISDGDRRSLRARSIRAHLRSCNDCASFQRSIGSRRNDLHLLAPWVSGAAVMGAIGLGAGGSGGALLAAGSGASAAAGGGGGAIWASLPMAVKGLAAAAAVATAGTAAVEIQHVAKPAHRTTTAQADTARPARATAAAALRAAARAAATSRAAAPRATPVRTGNSVRSTTSGVRSSAPARSAPPASSNAPLLAAPTVRKDAPPAAAAPARPAPAVHTPVVAQKPVETAIEKLNRLQKLVQQAYADAQAVAADGSKDALALAAGLLDQTLTPLTASIKKILASLGLAVPDSITAAAPATAPSSTPTTTTSVLAPVQQVVDGVESLIQKLLGQL
jgi:RNA polymerase sigma factor (sigma-70 family)